MLARYLARTGQGRASERGGRKAERAGGGGGGVVRAVGVVPGTHAGLSPRPEAADGPMRILVHEFASGGGLAGRRVPASLGREGAAMRDALIADLAAIRRHRIVTTVDPRFPLRAPPGVEVVTLPSGNAALLDALIASADAVWLVAPETGGCLERLAAQGGGDGDDAPGLRRGGDPPGVRQGGPPAPPGPPRRVPPDDARPPPGRGLRDGRAWARLSRRRQARAGSRLPGRVPRPRRARAAPRRGRWRAGPVEASRCCFSATCPAWPRACRSWPTAGAPWR